MKTTRSNQILRAVKSLPTHYQISKGAFHLNSTSPRVGLSGWQYREFRGILYDYGLPAKHMLAAYGKNFDTVEVNSSFYHFPRISTFKKWKEEAPEGFLYSLKANRYFTHMARLEGPDLAQKLNAFLESAKLLEESLGVVLFQLPQSFQADYEKLGRFLDLLEPYDLRFAFELRHPSWHQPHIFRLLRDHNVAFCIFDMKGQLAPIEITADYSYIRLHGPLSQPYRGSYSDSVLRDWSQRIATWERKKIQTFCYFDNTMTGDAVWNSLSLKSKLYPNIDQSIEILQ